MVAREQGGHSGARDVQLGAFSVKPTGARTRFELLAGMPGDTPLQPVQLSRRNLGRKVLGKDHLNPHRAFPPAKTRESVMASAPDVGSFSPFLLSRARSGHR